MYNENIQKSVECSFDFNYFSFYLVMFVFALTCICLNKFLSVYKMHGYVMEMMRVSGLTYSWWIWVYFSSHKVVEMFHRCVNTHT